MPTIDRDVCQPTVAPSETYTLADILRTQAIRQPTRPAIIEDDRRTTWLELWQGARKLAAALAAQGVGPGDTVAVLDAPSTEYVQLYFSLANLGAVLAPLNTRETAPVIADCLKRLEPTLVLAGRHTESLEATWVDKHFVVSTNDREDWAAQLLRMERDVLEETPRTILSSPQLLAIHLILFTSGTTGKPKGVCISQQRSLVNAIASAAASAVAPHHRVFAYQPLFHTGGWDVILQHLVVGASVVLQRKFDPEEAVRLFREHQCTSIFGVPIVLDEILSADDPKDTSLASIERVSFAAYDATPLMKAAGETFKERASRLVSFQHVYGQTEAGSYISVSQGTSVEDILSNVGRPVPGVVISIRDEGGREVPFGQVGEICLQGPAMMTEYLGQRTVTDETFREGWLHTGDIGKWDTNGCLEITGRMKQLIRTGGETVAPREVETVLLQHSSVKECLVFGLPDDRYDESVVAAVVRSELHTPTDQDLMAWLRGRVAGYKIPRRIYFMDRLPRTETGKLAREEVARIVDRVDS